MNCSLISILLDEKMALWMGAPRQFSPTMIDCLRFEDLVRSNSLNVTTPDNLRVRFFFENDANDAIQFNHFMLF